MSTEIPTEQPVAPPVETTEVPPAEPVDLAAEVAKWKALSRKNEERAKENDAAAKRLAEIDEANKTEAEKLQARADAAEKALAEREAADTLQRLTAEVAEAKGVPAAVLRGATREDLEAHADTYLASLPVIPPVPAVPTAHGQGSIGAPIGSENDIEARITAATAAGDWKTVISLQNTKLPGVAAQ